MDNNTIEGDGSAGCAWLILGALFYLAVSIGGYFLIKLAIETFTVAV